VRFCKYSAIKYINIHATSMLVGNAAEMKAIMVATDASHIKVKGTKSLIERCCCNRLIYVCR